MSEPIKQSLIDSIVKSEPWCRVCGCEVDETCPYCGRCSGCCSEQCPSRRGGNWRNEWKPTAEPAAAPGEVMQQVEFLISEAMKRLENENIDAAYSSLKAALEWIDGEEGK